MIRSSYASQDASSDAESLGYGTVGYPYGGGSSSSSHSASAHEENVQV